MYISKVQINGFRSLGDTQADLQPYTCLIGKNDCGKSAFLHALLLLFDPTKNLTGDDRCKIPGCEGEYFIEATLSDCNGNEDLITNNEIRVRRMCGERVPTWQYRGSVPKSETLKKMFAGNLTKQELAGDDSLSEAIKEFVQSELQRRGISGRVSKETWKEVFEELSEKYLVQWEEGWCSLDSERLSSLVQVVMLEADVRGEEALSDSNESVFSRVGGLILREATKNHKGIVNAVSSLRQEIQKVATKNDQGEWEISQLNDFETVLNEEVRMFDGEITASSSLIPPRVLKSGHIY